MANATLKSFLSSLVLRDEDDEDEYEAYLREQEALQANDGYEERKPHSVRQAASDDQQSSSKSYASESRPRPSFAERRAQEGTERRTVSEERKSTASNVVPLRNVRSNAMRGELEVSIIKPLKFDDCELICDALLKGRATIVNFEGFDDEIAQRIMDFVSGCIYTINGRLGRISDRIFIVSAEGVDISGDFSELLGDDLMETPVLRQDF